MCFNYNLVPTEKNRDYVLGNTVLMAVGGRGFNITQSEYGDFYSDEYGDLRRAGSNSGTRTLFGPYIPFAVETEYEGKEALVCGSLLPDAAVFPLMLLSNGYTTTVTSLPGSVTASQVQHEALALMQRAFTQSWNQIKTQTVSDKQLVLPNTITNLGVSSAANPGVMALVDGIDLGSTATLRSEAFTGYKAVLRREVAGFKLDGELWYCYYDQLDDGKSITVTQIFNDMTEAAKAGYNPHMG